MFWFKLMNFRPLLTTLDKETLVLEYLDDEGVLQQLPNIIWSREL